MAAYTIADIIENSKSKKFSMIILACSSMTWFAVGPTTLVSSQISPFLKCEWKLSTFQIALLSSALNIGLALGCFFFGYIGDVYGRKPALLMSQGFCFYFTLLSASSQSMNWYFATRVLVGMGVAGTFNMSVVLCLEYVKMSERGVCSLVQMVAFQFGNTLSIFLGFLVLEDYGWRVFLVCIQIVPAISLPFVLWLPESMRFLQITGNREEILKILQRQAIINKQELPKKINMECRPTKNQASFSYLFQKYGFQVAMMTVVFISCMVSYYGVSFLTVFNLLKSESSCDHHKPTVAAPGNTTTYCSKLNNDILLGDFYINIGGLIGPLIGYVVLERLGRKILLTMSLLITALVYVLQLVCVPRLVHQMSMFIITGSACTFGTYLYLFTAETYPTVVRSTSLGIVTTAGKAASVFVPFIFQDMIYYSLPGSMGLMIGLTLLSVICLQFLDETKGKKIERE